MRDCLLKPGACAKAIGGVANGSAASSLRTHGSKRLRIMPAALQDPGGTGACQRRHSLCHWQGRAANLRHFSGFSLLAKTAMLRLACSLRPKGQLDFSNRSSASCGPAFPTTGPDPRANCNVCMQHSRLTQLLCQDRIESQSRCGTAVFASRGPGRSQGKPAADGTLRGPGS